MTIPYFIIDFPFNGHLSFSFLFIYLFCYYKQWCHGHSRMCFMYACGYSQEEKCQAARNPCFQPHETASGCIPAWYQLTYRCTWAPGFGIKTAIPSRSAKYARALGNRSCVCLNRIAITTMKKNSGQNWPREDLEQIKCLTGQSSAYRRAGHF